MKSNKEELMSQLEPEKAAKEAAAEPVKEEAEQLEPEPQRQEEFDVPEEAFLKGVEQ